MGKETKIAFMIAIALALLFLLSAVSLAQAPLTAYIRVNKVDYSSREPISAWITLTVGPNDVVTTADFMKKKFERELDVRGPDKKRITPKYYINNEGEVEPLPPPPVEYQTTLPANTSYDVVLYDLREHYQIDRPGNYTVRFVTSMAVFNGADRTTEVIYSNIEGFSTHLGIVITDAYTTDREGNRRTTFEPKEPIQFHIEYDVIGEENTEYKVRARIRIFQKYYPILTKTEFHYPGTGYHIVKDRHQGKRIKVPATIPFGKTKTIYYKLKLKSSGGQVLDIDQATSQITVVEPQ